MKTVDEIIEMQFGEIIKRPAFKDKLKNIIIIASEQAYWQGRKDMIRSDKKVVFIDYLKLLINDSRT